MKDDVIEILQVESQPLRKEGRLRIDRDRDTHNQIVNYLGGLSGTRTTNVGHEFAHRAKKLFRSIDVAMIATQHECQISCSCSFGAPGYRSFDKSNIDLACSVVDFLCVVDANCGAVNDDGVRRRICEHTIMAGQNLVDIWTGRQHGEYRDRSRDCLPDALYRLNT